MTAPGPRLLVSVRCGEEARAALDGGADVIDIKEPSVGPLGMASARTIAEVMRRAGQRRPITAALGELSQWATHRDAVPACFDRLAFVKLGLADAPHDWKTRLGAVADQFGRGRFIVAAYADEERAGSPRVRDVLGWAVDQRVAGLLIDTAVKDGRGTLAWLGLDSLGALCQEAREHRLLIAVAGGLTVEDVPGIARLGPDVIAVRGAACVGCDRTARVDARRVRSLSDALTACEPATGLPAVAQAHRHTPPSTPAHPVSG